jgi:hypothetical protein
MYPILLAIDKLYSLTVAQVDRETAVPSAPTHPLYPAIYSTLGAAITAMGAPLFLEVLPLNLTR